MRKGNPVLSVSLLEFTEGNSQLFTKGEVLGLQQMFRIYTVGNFLSAWRLPQVQKNIEQWLDSGNPGGYPGRARFIAVTLASWVGISCKPACWTPRLEEALTHFPEETSSGTPKSIAPPA